MANASLNAMHQDRHEADAYRRIDLMTGTARRRRWTIVEKAAIVARFNAISEGLAAEPPRHAPIFRKTDDGLAVPHLWCMGFLAGMRLRLDAWEPLLDLNASTTA